MMRVELADALARAQRHLLAPGRAAVLRDRQRHPRRGAVALARLGDAVAGRDDVDVRRVGVGRRPPAPSRRRCGRRRTRRPTRRRARRPATSGRLRGCRWLAPRPPLPAACRWSPPAPGCRRGDLWCGLRDRLLGRATGDRRCGARAGRAGPARPRWRGRRRAAAPARRSARAAGAGAVAPRISVRPVATRSAARLSSAAPKRAAWATSRSPASSATSISPVAGASGTAETITRSRSRRSRSSVKRRGS